MSGRGPESNVIADYFDSILDVLNDGIYISDRTGKTLKINKMYEKLTGLKEEELLGHCVTDLVREGIYNIVLNPEIVKTGQHRTSVQITKVGRKVILDGYPVFDEHGKVALVLTFVRDVTLLSQLKEQIAQQQELIEMYQSGVKYLAKKNVQGSPVIYQSQKMAQVLQLLNRVAKVDTTVLLLGETGVGKDILARKIHESSPRSGEPFFKVDCAAIPPTLIESELFGYDPGAFSGANTKGKAGFIELADKGSLFLDEIGELPMAMQVKLLRVLQDQEIMRIGSTKVRKVNIRIIAATNRNLEDAVRDGTFRSDLYYRLRVAVLNIPPLRERQADIIPLVKFFLEKYNTKYRTNVRLSPEVERAFLSYHWPGNIRELENLVQCLAVTGEKEVIDLADLPTNMVYPENDRSKLVITTTFDATGKSLATMHDELERELLRQALAQCGSPAEVAKALSVDRATIYRKMRKHNLA